MVRGGGDDTALRLHTVCTSPPSGNTDGLDEIVTREPGTSITVTRR